MRGGLERLGWVIAGAGAVLVGGAALMRMGRIRQVISRLGRRWTNLHPEVRDRALNVMDRLAQQGILVGVPPSGGWRPLEEQRAEIGEGDSQVTDPRNSYHVWGLAVDFVPINDAGRFHWPPVPAKVWRQIGQAIKAEGGEWGGDFEGFFDGPHGQWPQIAGRIGELKTAYGQPQAFLQEVQPA